MFQQSFSKKRWYLRLNQVLNSTVSFAGGATWAGSVQVYIEEGEAAAREWLRTQGRKNIEELNAVLTKTASSWSEKVVEPVFA